jgi:hypothetical protein
MASQSPAPSGSVKEEGDITMSNTEGGTTVGVEDLKIMTQVVKDLTDYKKPE